MRVRYRIWFGVFGVGAVLLFALGFVAGRYTQPNLQKPFNRQLWLRPVRSAAQEPVRYYMLDDLMDHYLVPGTSRSAARRLLGEPDRRWKEGDTLWDSYRIGYVSIKGLWPIPASDETALELGYDRCQRLVMRRVMDR